MMIMKFDILVGYIIGLKIIPKRLHPTAKIMTSSPLRKLSN